MPSGLELRVPLARSQSALAYLKCEGLKIKYVGPGELDSEAATVRTNFPAPLDLPLFYFEVRCMQGVVADP